MKHNLVHKAGRQKLLPRRGAGHDPDVLITGRGTRVFKCGLDPAGDQCVDAARRRWLRRPRA
jgi:hypothetical protein